MILKVEVLVDVDTTDTDIEDMRDEILAEVADKLTNEPDEFGIYPTTL